MVEFCDKETAQQRGSKRRRPQGELYTTDEVNFEIEFNFYYSLCGRMAHFANQFAFTLYRLTKIVRK